MARPQLIDLPKVPDPRGNLSFIQNGSQIPFDMKRVYWIYDVPGGEVRHGHAFLKQQELIVALSGSFDVVVDDGRTRTTYHLCRSFTGLYLPPMTWRELNNFSTNSVAMVISSESYDEDDYIRDFNHYRMILDGRVKP